MQAGQQIILDLYNCNYEKLSNLLTLEEIIKQSMELYAITPLNCCSETYEESSDLSVLVFHAHGHIILHTAPETGFASLDAFSTVTNIAFEKITKKIKQLLGAEKTKTTYLKRGDFGSLNDMKPTIHKNIKPWRRVRNTGARVFKLIVNKKNQTMD